MKIRYALVVLPLLALGACSTAGQSLYALDQAYATGAQGAATAISSGAVTNAQTIVQIKAASQAAHDALKAASQAEATGASNTTTLIAAAEAAIADLNNLLVTVGK